MSYFPVPETIETSVAYALPDQLRLPGRTPWADANKGGALIDSFLEGPGFDEHGELWLVDIPNGRILSVTQNGEWTVRVDYDGWPNGMRLLRDGSALIADHKLGLVRLWRSTGQIEVVLETVGGEGFKGLNDLIVGRDGTVYFTDQGQTGLHDPSGRVWALRPDGGLECLLSNCASPNGVALDRAEAFLFVACTRSCQIWRVPLGRTAGPGKVQLFAQLPGGVSGPDGLAIDQANRLYVADPGHGSVWVLSPRGEPVYRLRSCAGRTLTNMAFDPSNWRRLVMTESESGNVLEAFLPAPGWPLYSHLEARQA